MREANIGPGLSIAMYQYQIPGVHVVSTSLVPGTLPYAIVAITGQLQPRQHRHTLRSIRGTVGRFQGGIRCSRTFNGLQHYMKLLRELEHVYDTMFYHVFFILWYSSTPY